MNGFVSPISNYLPLWIILVPFLAVPFILLSSKRPNWREFWTLAAAVLTLSLVAILLPKVWSGQLSKLSILEISKGIALSLYPDSLGTIFAIIASSLWVLTSIYSIGYMRGHKEKKQTRYFASFAICLGATLGVAFAANLLTFVVFYEILTIATYPLVIHKETKEAIRAGRKYLTYTLIGGVLLIAATAITFRLAGTLDFRAGGLFPETPSPAGAIRILFLLFFAGVGVKSAIIPLHGWLPAAMVAPTPVSALLHAVAVVKSGVFGVLRIVGFVFGPKMIAELSLNKIILIFAGSTIILSSLLALSQDDLKKRLAYSTIGHLAYIVLGAALLNPTAMVGSIMHLSMHATMKITLFFCAGTIFVNLHKTKVSELDGIGRVMPFTLSAFTIATIGLVGIPPVNGFVSKWFLAAGTIEAGKPILFAVLVLSGLLNAGYLFPIIFRSFFKSNPEQQKYQEGSAWMVVPLWITALISLSLGIFPDLFARIYQMAVAVKSSVFGGG